MGYLLSKFLFNNEKKNIIKELEIVINNPSYTNTDILDLINYLTLNLDKSSNGYIDSYKSYKRISYNFIYSSAFNNKLFLSYEMNKKRYDYNCVSSLLITYNSLISSRENTKKLVWNCAHKEVDTTEKVGRANYYKYKKGPSYKHWSTSFDRKLHGKLYTLTDDLEANV